MPPEDLQIQFRFDDEYRQSVLKTGDPDQWIEVSISVDSNRIYGDDSGGVTGFACSILLDLLDSVESIDCGRKAVVEFEYGPTWLAIEPMDDGDVRIAGVRSSFAAVDDPTMRRSIDKSEVIQASEWRTEVLETAREFCDRVGGLNPNVKSHESLLEISDRIEDIKTSW